MQILGAYFYIFFLEDHNLIPFNVEQEYLLIMHLKIIKTLNYHNLHLQHLQMIFVSLEIFRTTDKQKIISTFYILLCTIHSKIFNIVLAFGLLAGSYSKHKLRIFFKIPVILSSTLGLVNSIICLQISN